MIAKINRVLIYLCFINAFWGVNYFAQSAGGESAYYNIILARPTDKSITISLLPIKNITVYIEYKKTGESAYTKTDTKILPKDIPYVIELSNLSGNTKYSYHVNYKESTVSNYSVSKEYNFQTQRAKNTSFTFTIEADPHPYDKKGCHNLWDICFANQLKDSPDFMFDLGDTFGDDHTPTTTTSSDMKQLHLDNRSHFGNVCHSIPLLFCMGNHEGESGYYLLQTPPNNIAVNGTIWRKYYYPNPEPNSFYSGNTTVEGNGIGLPQNYYSFEWGDALFVILDAYRYYTVSAKPRNWDWTLGETQFKWFKQTLETSKAKYKFVFIHHILGETRGASAVANGYEWGGYNSKGTYEFDTMRPGWGIPIHQLMVKNGVNIFFQGHDHLYAKEELDGVVYQEVPMPSDSTYIIGTTDNGDAFTGIKYDASGHLRVTVNPNDVKVDYVRAWLPKDENSQHKNGEVTYSYSVVPKVTAVNKELELPMDFELGQNYPNPFNPETVIKYKVPVKSDVVLKVFDSIGREIMTLVNETKLAGSYDVKFNAFGLSSGVYFYQLKANGIVLTKKSILIK